MADQKPEISKSQSIRDVFKQNSNLQAKEVISILGAKGISVTEGHVYVVKGKMKSKGGRPRSEKAASANGSMAKKNASSKDAPNKSASIRHLLKENPSLGAKEVVATLGDQGISVTEGLVYFVKGKAKGRKGRRRRAQQTVAKVVTTTGSVDAVKTILKIKEWASEVGGLKKLKALVDALEG